jgi:hypothetical protein
MARGGRAGARKWWERKRAGGGGYLGTYLLVRSIQALLPDGAGVALAAVAAVGALGAGRPLLRTPPPPPVASSQALARPPPRQRARARALTSGSRTLDQAARK